MTMEPDADASSQRWLRLADGFAIAVAVVLPWSVSVVLVLMVLWLISVVVALGPAAIRREMMSAAGATPLLLLALGLAGMLWADIGWGERLGGADAFVKLLAIPLLLAQFRRSKRALCPLTGFLISCAALMVLSWVVAAFPAIGAAGPWAHKNAITLAGEFTLCGFVLLFMASDALRAQRSPVAAGMLALAFAFLATLVYLVVSPVWYTGPPAAAAVPVALLLLWLHKQFGGRMALAAFAAGAVACALVYLALPLAQIPTHAEDWLGRSRPVYWEKAVRFIAAAPVVGHGTGSITSLFARAAVGQTGTMAEIATNPFQETLSVGIQLGLAGIAALWAMWLAHLRLFRGHALADRVGLVIVATTVAGSLFDSQLFDAHRGWTYVFGVGIAGGMILRTRGEGTSAAR